MVKARFLARWIWLIWAYYICLKYFIMIIAYYKEELFSLTYSIQVLLK